MKQMLNTSGTFLGAIRQQLFDSWQPPKKEIQKSCEGHETILTLRWHRLLLVHRNIPDFVAGGSEPCGGFEVENETLVESMGT